MSKKNNVLLISVDHWFGELVGGLGHPSILTPTLDQMIGNGIAFTNAYTTTPICIPARREMMTGVSARTHGDRNFNETLPMPDLPTIAQTFTENGYQSYGVGKLHVYPQRDRIGFQDVMLLEEGRYQFGLNKDDYELYLQEEGYSGQEWSHGMSNNDYLTRTWHLPEHLHQINWTVKETCKYIARRDPGKPGFWYMSFSPPHTPLAPLSSYMDYYRSIDVDMPYYSEWSQNHKELPFSLKARPHGRNTYSEDAIKAARQAFYALATHVDHQIRLVIGLLREENIFDNTIVMFTSDHGDMLGNHGLYAKGLFYENSCRIPMILVPPVDTKNISINTMDDRLAVQADIFPTLAEMCEVPVPSTVEGLSLLGDKKRDYIYGELWDDARATRMLRDDKYKLIYYPAGNRFQLFDLENDPKEMNDLYDDNEYKKVVLKLSETMKMNFYGDDLNWIKNDQLVGMDDPNPNIEYANPGRSFGNQRGMRLSHSGPKSDNRTNSSTFR